MCPSGEVLVATTNRSPLRPLAMNVFAPDFHAHLARQARRTDRLSAPLCPPRRPESLPASKHGERRAAASSAVHGGRLWRPGEPPRGHSAAKLYGLRARLTSRCGMITDRDIVITCIAAGDDPSTTAVGELARGSVYNVDAHASFADMLTVMESHQVRRLPVVDGHRLVGIVNEADIPRHLPAHAVADFVSHLPRHAVGATRA